MKNFVQLLNFEFNRIFKLFVTFIIGIAVIQTTGVVLSAVIHLIKIKGQLNIGTTEAELIVDMEAFNLTYSLYEIWYAGPIIIAVVLIILYAILIWYRDWLGKNTFIYRLLMLPTSRLNLFMAKLVTIKLALLSVAAVQYLLLILHANVVKWIIPAVYRQDLNVAVITMNSEYLRLLFPSSITGFLTVYGVILLAIISLFLIVLLERSFRVMGIVVGITYGVVATIILSLPAIIQYMAFEGDYLYPGEAFAVQAVIYAIIVGVSLMFARFLLKNKVTV